MQRPEPTSALTHHSPGLCTKQGGHSVRNSPSVSPDGVRDLNADNNDSGDGGGDDVTVLTAGTEC